jgi:hypothetical protein
MTFSVKIQNSRLFENKNVKFKKFSEALKKSKKHGILFLIISENLVDS